MGPNSPTGFLYFALMSVFYIYFYGFKDRRPGAGAFVFSFRLIFFHLSTDQAQVWRNMEMDDGEEDGWTFGELRSVWIVGLFKCFGGVVGDGFFPMP